MVAIMPVTAETIVCGDCGAPLKDALPSDDPMQRKPCESCGSTKRNYHVFIVESVTLRDGLGMKAGDRITFTLMPDATVLMRVKSKSVTELAGLLHKEGRKPVPIEQLSR